MEKIKALGILEVDANELQKHDDVTADDQVRTLSDLEMLFVGGGDDIPAWKP
jgi:hypothetical protein